MADLNVFIAGDRELSLKFDQFPAHLHAQLKQRITGLADELADRVRGAAPKKTGKLESEIQTQVRDTDHSITGVVYVSGEFAKAGALEYGAHRPVEVHRKVKGVVARFRKSVGLPTGEFTRTPNVPEFRYLRGPEAAMEVEVAAELQAVVDETLSQDL